MILKVGSPCGHGPGNVIRSVRNSILYGSYLLVKHDKIENYIKRKSVYHTWSYNQFKYIYIIEKPFPVQNPLT